MVKLLVGRKGTGKTKIMVDMANDSLRNINGSIVFINKDHSLTYDLKYRIRVICMEDFKAVVNTDGMVGFICGIISQDHDIETIYIDSILHYRSIKPEDMEQFLAELAKISEKFGPDFVVSLSADKDDLGDFISRYEVLN